MKKLALVTLSLLAFSSFSPALRAQKPRLTVSQTAKTTVVKVHYKPIFNLLKLPDFVLFGFGVKKGTTRFNFKSALFLSDLVFDIDKAIVLPGGKLDPKGDLVYKLPFGNQGVKTFTFYLQANVLHFTMTVFPKAGFIGKFLKSNLVKLFLGIGFGR